MARSSPPTMPAVPRAVPNTVARNVSPLRFRDPVGTGAKSQHEAEGVIITALRRSPATQLHSLSPRLRSGPIASQENVFRDEIETESSKRRREYVVFYRQRFELKNMNFFVFISEMIINIDKKHSSCYK